MVGAGLAYRAPLTFARIQRSRLNNSKKSFSRISRPQLSISFDHLISPSYQFWLPKSV